MNGNSAHRYRVVEFDGTVCSCGALVTSSVENTAIKAAWKEHLSAVTAPTFVNGARVHVVGNRYPKQKGVSGVDFTDYSGTVVGFEPEHENPVEVELDHLGYSQMFHPSELVILP